MLKLTLESLEILDAIARLGSFGRAAEELGRVPSAVTYAVRKMENDLDTLIFVVEDDAQDGPDHVDAHRSTAYVVGPYVKKGAVVSRDRKSVV